MNHFLPKCSVVVATALLASGELRGSDFFRTQVAPILQQRCFHCHNDEENKGDFSLQSSASAMAGGQIEPGDAAASHLIELLRPVDGVAEMPKDADPLSVMQLGAIRQWIDQGAQWPSDVTLAAPEVDDFSLWSYQPVVKPSVPKLTDPWIQTPIDAFILRRHREHGLTHGNRASRRDMIRRLYYDLTGLPPGPDEVAEFVEDSSPDAYGNLVDRLLESKRYGERWARHWLDVVKYADTCGYDKDKLRPNAWPYRDYVIRSLNSDKPYARFVQEQIAGDVLFPGEPDGILGLGFIAAGPWDFIGHVEVPESKIDGKVARNLDRDDMVANTMNTFCSLTVQCARCHNHKFDPITQQHYYGLQSIFAAVDRAERVYDLDPKVLQTRRELETKITDLNAERENIAKEIADAGGERLTALQSKMKTLQQSVKVKKDPAFGYHSSITRRADDEKWVAIELAHEVENATIIVRPCHDEFAGIGSGFGFPVRFKIEVQSDGDKWVTLSDQTQRDFSNPGLVAFEVEARASIRRVRVTATRLVERKNDYILALAELQVMAGGKNVALGAKVSSGDSIEAPVRWARTNLTDGKWPTAGSPEEMKQLAEATKQRDVILAEIETPEIVRRRETALTALQAANDALAKLPAGKMVYAAATQFKPQGNFHPTGGKPRAVHVLHRGNVQQPGELASSGVIPLVHDQSDWRFGENIDESQRRAALARWLVNPDNPLVWRSIVNRVWHYHFGRGIVETPNDFGRMGASPTHPELLDWLACEFRDNGGSMKRLHRLIVTSSVYQQSTDFSESSASHDQGNQFLWRMNRRRLSAEEIRDSILSVSGKLDLTMGGPGFYLFALEKTAHSPHYEYHKFDPADSTTHRRSIYRFIVRSQPDPWMTTLDCADSSQSTPRRNETLTSLQALSLMNNRFNLAMAKCFAEDLKCQSKDLSVQISMALARVMQREVKPDEKDKWTAYASEHGLENACRFMFNLSEFVYLD